MLMVVQALLKCHANIHAWDETSCTPLHLTSFSGHADIIVLLLEHGADLEAQDCDRDTPLHLAAQEGKLNAVKTLLVLPPRRQLLRLKRLSCKSKALREEWRGPSPTRNGRVHTSRFGGTVLRLA